jgi:hypothetical protein
MKHRSKQSNNGNPIAGFPVSTFFLTRSILRAGLLGGLAFAGAPLLAQNTTADVVGTATDSSGAVIPNAKVELVNTDTNESRIVTSGAGGEYTFTLLKPSHYSLSVTAPGFKAFKIGSFTLSAGDRAREDSHLTVGGAGETDGLCRADYHSDRKGYPGTAP